MPDILFWSLIFILTLVTLIFSADFFIKASERIGLAVGIPPFIVGVTLIAMGTSLPELVTSMVAILGDPPNSEIILGNVVGSNIANICLVLAIVGILGNKITLQFDVMRVDMPMVLGAAFILFVCVMDGDFSLFEGIICLSGMLVYLIYVLQLGRNEEASSLGIDVPDEENKQIVSWKEPIILLISSTIIYFSAEYNVQAIVRLSEIMEVGKELIALTAVSIGTSLPELVVSIVAVRMGNGEMAVGNVLGSNIFNVFAVMGIPRLFGEIVVPASILEFSIPVMLIASLLFFFVVLDREVSRWEGLVLLLLYFLFMGNLIGIYI